MDTTDSNIVFNKNGICNYCLDYIKSENQRRIDRMQRPWILESIKKAGIGKKYDCIIGLSGGVDSSLCLHYLKENKLRPLTFTVNNGWNNPKADENIMHLVEHKDNPVPFYRFVLDKQEFSDLQVAFVKSGVKNIEIPTDHMIMAVSYQMAIENDVKYIISGGNIATESIMPLSWGYQPKDLKHIKGIFRKFMKRELSKLPTVSLAQYIWYRFIKKIQIVSLLDFYEYNREQAKKELNKIYGWQDYGEKHHESIFTWWFQTWYLPTKWGIDKRKAHYSSLINSGQMTRKEALEKLLERLEYPKLGIEERILKYPNKDYREYPNNERLWNFLSKIYKIIK